MIVDVQHIAKNFDAIRAVDDVSFEVHAGTCVGLLGPNGAGKSTSIKMLYGLFPPDAGTLRVFDLPVWEHRKEIKRQLGVVMQQDIMEMGLSALENLRQHGRYFGWSAGESDPRSRELLRWFELDTRMHDPVHMLSGGMRRRLSIAKALLNQPRLLILDEPTIGLDPQARRMLWDRIAQIKAQGTAILLTTHYMEEAEQLCDDVYIIDHGKIIAHGTPRELIAAHAMSNAHDANIEHNLETVFLNLTGRQIRDN